MIKHFGKALLPCNIFPIGLTQQEAKSWHSDYDYCNDYEITEWYEGYKKRKAPKEQIEKELMCIAWHPSRWWDWCVPEDEEKETETLWK